MGEYESAHTWSNEGLKERKEHPLLPLSMLACPARRPFCLYPRKKAQYIALYIKKGNALWTCGSDKGRMVDGAIGKKNEKTFLYSGTGKSI